MTITTEFVVWVVTLVTLVYVWWQWVDAEAKLHDLRGEFAKYIGEADQRFLRFRDGRKNVEVGRYDA